MARRGLTEPLLRAIDQTLTDMRVCLPARVESYDPATQRAEVTPLLRRRYADGREESMPVIAGVPVVWPRSGGASLTMPVLRGDGVLLVFADRSLDRWLVQGGEVTPDDSRKHHLSDAIAIPGLYSFAEEGPQDNNEDVLLQFAGSSVRLTGDGNAEVTTEGNVTVTATGDVAVTTEGDATVTASGDVTLTCANLTVTADSMTIDGPLTTLGGITNSGGVIESNGVVVEEHIHGNVMTGGGVTGGPI